MSIKKIEELLDMEDPWSFELEENSLKEAILELFRMSFEKCPEYRNYCESHGIEDPDSVEDVLQVPLLPGDIFKRKIVSNVSDEQIEKICMSSGTTGEKSKIPRDERTLENSRKAFVHAFTNVSGVKKGGSIGLFMPVVPDPENKEVTWMLEILPPVSRRIAQELHSFVGKEGPKPPAETKEIIAGMESAPRNLLSTPPVIYDFCQSLDEKLPLDSESIVLTGGGWKTKKEIGRDEFNQTCADTFGISKDQVRDTLALTELSSCFNECEYQRKHIPPWLKVTVRDVNDPDTEVEDGKEGILGFMEPISLSYPALFLTKDLGVVHKEPCPCGRKGKTMEFRGRAQGAEARGCALADEENQ